MKPVVVGSIAAAEAEEAIAFYNSRPPGKGDELREAIGDALAAIGKRPKASSKYGRKYRKKLVSGFPYAIFYAEYRTHVWVAAIYHGSRKPDAWMDREPD